jgi:hypothetical protein
MSKVSSSVKDRPLYRALRDEGVGKKKAARVTKAVDGEVGPPPRPRRSSDYEDRTKEELLDRARKNGIAGRSAMTKSQLIKALRRRQDAAR